MRRAADLARPVAQLRRHARGGGHRPGTGAGTPLAQRHRARSVCHATVELVGRSAVLSQHGSVPLAARDRREGRGLRLCRSGCWGGGRRCRRRPIDLPISLRVCGTDHRHRAGGQNTQTAMAVLPGGSHLPGGMSGGPVTNAGGHVVGVVQHGHDRHEQWRTAEPLLHRQHDLAPQPAFLPNTS